MLRRLDQIDFTPLKNGLVLELEFDPYLIDVRVLKQMIRHFVMNRIRNKNPLITVSRKGSGHLDNVIRCDPNEKYKRRHVVERDDRYSIVTTGEYVYKLQDYEKRDITTVRNRISGWIQRNCQVIAKSHYDPCEGKLFFYNPLFGDKDEENQAPIFERPEW